MRLITLCVLAVFAIGWVFGGSAFAASTTGTSIHIHSQVLPSCRATGGTLDFGSYDGNDATGSTNVTVTCNATGVIFNVALDKGQHMGIGYRQIKNTAGADELRYQLCNATPCPLSAGSSLEWGDADYAASYIYGNSVVDTSGATPSVLTLYGTLFGRSLNPLVAPSVAGSEYADNVTITVHF